MSVGSYLRSFFSFALQLVPCAMLLPVPFREEAFRKGKRRAYALLAALSVGLSLCYPLDVWWFSRMAEKNTNLDDNVFMLLAVVGVTALFFRITRERHVRKFTVLFVVISYAAVQFFLSNILMDFLPLKKQDMIYNDATLAAYLIVTAMLLPPVVCFMRSKMKRYLDTLETAAGARMELLFLAVILVMYLTLNALYSALWVRLRDTLQLSFVYYIPFALFLSILLIFTFYCIINLSVFKTRSAEQAVELALMRQNYDHIEENISKQKRALHDTRQLLRNVSTLAKEGTKEELLQYLDEAMQYASVSDRRFCANPCVNGLLGYYAAIAEAQGIALSVRTNCNRLPFSDADLTILLGNALDNAIRAAAEYREANPAKPPEIRFTADTIKDQFAFEIENPCLAVSYAPSSLNENSYFPHERWLKVQ